MSLPRGSVLPALAQTLLWVLRPVPFMEGCMRRYGDCFTVRLLDVGTVVFLADPDAIKTVFTGDPELFHAGEANQQVLEPVLGRHSVLLLDGDDHVRERRLMLPAFHGERMQRYESLIAEATDRQIERWPTGEPFALHTSMQAVTLNVILRAVFGIDDAGRRDELRDLLRGLVDMIGGASRMRMLVRIWRARSGRDEEFLGSLAQVDAVLFDEIRRRRSDPATAQRDDILSLLLQARDEDGSPMTDVELRDELMTLLVAGHETTATALAWCFESLFRHPEVMERLVGEVEQEDDSYVDAVVTETLRLRPILPLVARKLMAPMELKGYSFPAGTIVAPCIYLTHRLPDVYPEPDAFRPERFLEHPAGTYTWIPFGGGVRRCLGASFATFEMKVVLRTILRRARLRPAGAPEVVRRRSITFAPARGARAILDELREAQPRDSDREPVIAA